MICTSTGEVTMTCIKMRILHDVLWLVFGMVFTIPCLFCSPFWGRLNCLLRGCFLPHMTVENARATNEQDKLDILSELGGNKDGVNRMIHEAFRRQALFGMPTVS